MVTLYFKQSKKEDDNKEDDDYNNNNNSHIEEDIEEDKEEDIEEDKEEDKCCCMGNHRNLQRFRYFCILFNTRYWKDLNQLPDLLTWIEKGRDHKHLKEPHMPNYHHLKKYVPDSNDDLLMGLYDWVNHSDISGSWTKDQINRIYHWCKWIFDQMVEEMFSYVKKDVLIQVDLNNRKYKEWDLQKDLQNIDTFIESILNDEMYELEKYDDHALEFFVKLVHLKQFFHQAILLNKEIYLD